MSANTTASVPKKLEPASYKSSANNSYSKSYHNNSTPPPQPQQPPQLNHQQTPTSSSSSSSHPGLLPIVSQPVNSMLAISGGLLPIDHFRLKLYNYAMAERLRCTGGYPPGHCPPSGQMPLCHQPLSVGESPAQRVAAAAMMGQYGPGLALSMSLFQNRMFSSAEEPKPQHSYIGLIAMAILGAPDQKLVLSDIYQHILDNYPYFRSRGPGWRNSIRHNLSLNDCFVKAGRSANGKGHYWAIHPANVDDFKKGDFRRRKAQRKVRKHMGLAVDDAGTDSPSPPPMTDPFTSPWAIPHVPGMDLIATNASLYHPPPPPANHHVQFSLGQTTGHSIHQPSVPFTDPFHHNLLQRHHQQLQMISSKLSSRKRQFDVASLLAPDDQHHQCQEIPAKRSYTEITASEDSNDGVHATRIIQSSSPPSSDIEADIDVEANENEEETDEEIHREQSPEMNSYFSNSTSSKFEVRHTHRTSASPPQLPPVRDAVKRRRLLLSTDEDDEQREEQDQKQQQQQHQQLGNKFPWPGVIPVGFEKSLLERYYGQNHHHQQQQQNHHQHVHNQSHLNHHPSAMEDAHSTTGGGGGDGKKCQQPI